MTSEERAQLIEDIRRSASMREHIIEQASADKEFDIAAAWETLDELEHSNRNAGEEIRFTKVIVDCRKNRDLRWSCGSGRAIEISRARATPPRARSREGFDRARVRFPNCRGSIVGIGGAERLCSAADPPRRARVGGAFATNRLGHAVQGR